MSNLNFKWGLHTNLPTKLTEDQIGSLFFTKDEGSLYLGVEAGQKPRRIQGVVQYYADLSQFKSDVLPPYSTDVIYYIASENALVKWSGEKIAADGTKTSGEFVVLNVTASEFTTAVNDLSSSIAENADNITDNATDITNLRTDLGEKGAAAGDTTAFARIKQLENAVKALEELAGIGGDGTSGSLNERIGTLEAWKQTAHTDIEDLKNDFLEHDSTISEHGTRIGDLETWKTDTDTRIDNLETWKTDTVDPALEDHGTRLGVAEGEIDAIEGDIESITGDISRIDGEISGIKENYYTKEEVDTQHTDLSDTLTNQLNSHIAAANALVYIGGVDSPNDWNTIKGKDAPIGNTYVVTASGLTLNINGTDVTCYAGDLLIATGTETTNNAIPAANIQWVHVKAGYNEELASTLSVADGDGVDANKKAVIQLSSYVGTAEGNYGDLGKFFIASDSNNLEVKVSDKNVNISMVWDNF